MNTGSVEALASARRTLHTYEIDTAEIDHLAQTLSRQSSQPLSRLLAQFDEIADGLPYADDADYGALLLEARADATEDASLTRELLMAAVERAWRCVQAASAGGEALARKVDAERLEAKIAALPPNEAP